MGWIERIEQETNQMVYVPYGLTEEEIAYAEQ